MTRYWTELLLGQVHTSAIALVPVQLPHLNPFGILTLAVGLGNWNFGTHQSRIISSGRKRGVMCILWSGVCFVPPSAHL